MSGDLEPVHRNDLRASHEDRDAIVDRLRVAAGDGRIDGDELDQRIEAALNARTYGELAVVVKDLPESPEASAKAVSRRAEAAETQAITVTHGHSTKNGAWLVPRQLVITARHANIRLDFSEAVFSDVREVELVLDTRHSNLKMITPAGSTIDESGLERRHTSISNPRQGPAGADAVRIRLTGRIEHTKVRFRALGFWRRRARIRHDAAQRALGRH